MPHIAVTMFPGRDNETKQALSLKLQAFLAEELNISKEVVSVSVEDIPKEKWNESMRKIPAEAMFVELGNK